MRKTIADIMKQNHCHATAWNSQIAYFDMTKESAFTPNYVHELLDCYTYGLVEEGVLTLSFNGEDVEAHAGDIIIYMPGLDLKTKHPTDNFKAKCLMVASSFAANNRIMRLIFQTSYFPVIHLRRPILTIPPQWIASFHNVLNIMHRRITLEHNYKASVIQELYGLFLLDLMHVQTSISPTIFVSARQEQLFIEFINLLQQHFRKHHDIGFYAENMKISSVYLSKLIRKVSNHSVIDFINQQLTMDACWQLSFTDASTSYIANQLGFADQSSFSKFFTRMKGTTPSQYRKKRQ